MPKERKRMRDSLTTHEERVFSSLLVRKMKMTRSRRNLTMRRSWKWDSRRREPFLDKPPNRESDEESVDSGNEDNFHVDLSEGDDDAEPRSAFPDEAEAESQEDEAEIIEPTRRFAVVNMDWDNMRAIDLYTVFSSVLTSAQQPQGSSKRRQEDSQPPPSGKLLKVTIYPSEFGKERMAKEEAEGPSAEVFAASARPEFKGKGKQIELRPSRKLAKSSRRAAAAREDDLEESDTEAYSDEDIEDDMSNAESDISGNESQDDDLSEDEEADDDGIDDVLGKVRYDSESEGDDESLDGDGGVDMDKLRSYQLERLRYVSDSHAPSRAGTDLLFIFRHLKILLCYRRVFRRFSSDACLPRSEWH
jgi:hypothetical protein